MPDLITAAQIAEQARVRVRSVYQASRRYHWVQPQGSRGVYYTDKGIITPLEFIQGPHKRGVHIIEKGQTK